MKHYVGICCRFFSNQQIVEWNKMLKQRKHSNEYGLVIVCHTIYEIKVSLWKWKKFLFPPSFAIPVFNAKSYWDYGKDKQVERERKKNFCFFFHCVHLAILQLHIHQIRSFSYAKQKSMQTRNQKNYVRWRKKKTASERQKFIVMKVSCWLV